MKNIKDNIAEQRLIQTWKCEYGRATPEELARESLRDGRDQAKLVGIFFPLVQMRRTIGWEQIIAVDYFFGQRRSYILASNPSA